MKTSSRLLNAIHSMDPTPVLIVLSPEDGEALMQEYKSAEMFTEAAPGPVYQQKFNGIPYAIASVERTVFLVQPPSREAPELHVIP